MKKKQFEIKRSKPKNSTFIAAYHGHCSAGDDIEPGDDCCYVNDEATHVSCAEDLPPDKPEQLPCNNQDCLYLNMVHSGDCV